MSTVTVNFPGCEFHFTANAAVLPTDRSDMYAELVKLSQPYIERSKQAVLDDNAEAVAAGFRFEFEEPKYEGPHYGQANHGWRFGGTIEYRVVTPHDTTLSRAEAWNRFGFSSSGYNQTP